MKPTIKTIFLILILAFTANITFALTQKEINYLLFNGIECSLITPTYDDLYFQIKEKNSKVFVSIEKKNFEAQEFKIKNDTISFYILTSDNPESKLTFTGRIFKSLMSGMVTDTKDLKGTWLIKLQPIRTLFLYTPSSLVSSQNTEQTSNSYGQKFSNPIKNWTYEKAAGDYYDVVVKKLKKDRVKYYRYRKFPVTCWIQPMKADWINQIRTSLNFVNYFIPIQFVNSQSEADLTIKLGSPEDIKKTCEHKTALGCGGSRDVSKTNYKGQLLLSPDIFQEPNTNGIILHEIVHTFGILGHSKNKEDLMYSYSYNQNNFTAADLNTLWLHYNQ